MAPQQTTIYPWVPGQAKLGFDVHNQGVVVGELFQKQGGQYSFPPAVTQPGTVASAGTVVNSTGADCWVYLFSSLGISGVKIVNYNGTNAGTVSLPGTVPAATMVPVFVPGPAAAIVSYAGTLNWTWQPA